MIRGLAPCVAACAKPLCGLQGNEGSSSARLSPLSATRHRCRRATARWRASAPSATSWATGSWACARGWARSFRLRTRRPTTRRWSRTSTRGASHARAFMAQAYGVARARALPRLRVHADVLARNRVPLIISRCAAVPFPPAAKVRGDNLTALIPASLIPHLLQRAAWVIELVSRHVMRHLCSEIRSRFSWQPTRRKADGADHNCPLPCLPSAPRRWGCRWPVHRCTRRPSTLLRRACSHLGQRR